MNSSMILTLFALLAFAAYFSASANAEDYPVCPPQDGEHPTYFPSEICTQFYECSNGKAHLLVCPPGQEFNPVLHVCDDPDRAGCVKKATDNPICPPQDGADPTYIPSVDCTQFYECSNGSPKLISCPPGQEFNPVLNVCDNPAEAGCKTHQD